MSLLVGNRGAALALSAGVPSSALDPMSYGAVGDGVTNDYTALKACEADCIRRGVPMTFSHSHAIGTKWAPANGFVYRGPYSLGAKLIATGGLTTTDIFEITGTGALSYDIDGLVIDANRSGSAVRTVAPPTQCVFGVHGAMTTGAPALISGVRLGRIMVMNANAPTGFCFVNVTGLTVDLLEGSSIWGAMVMWAGLQNSYIKRIGGSDIGNLRADGSRAGQLVSNFVEPDPTKAPAGWYTVANRYNPSQNILPTANVLVDIARGYGCTDTAIYNHDFLSTAAIGNTDVRYGLVDIYCCGKDAFKAREGAIRVSCDFLRVRNTANRFFVAENFATDTRLGGYDCDGAGVDALGIFFGGDYTYTGGSNKGLGQSITDSPGGIVIDDHATKVTIGPGIQRNINTSPVDGSQGHAIYVTDTDQVQIFGAVVNTAGAYGFRASNMTNFKVEVEIRNANRTSGTAFAYIHNDAAVLGTHAGTITTTNGSNIVTGVGTNFTSFAQPGTLIWSVGVYLGRVVATFSTTSMVLDQSAAAVVTGAAWSTSYTTGLITCTTGSAVITGTGTLFLTDQLQPASIGQSMYNNGTRLGRILSIQSDTQVTLEANALANVTADTFYYQESARGSFALAAIETSGVAVAQYSLRTDNNPAYIDIPYISAFAADFTTTAASTSEVATWRIDAGAKNVRFRQPQPAAVSVYASSTTLTTAQSGMVMTNTGASGLVTFTLPAPAANLTYRFIVDSANGIKVTATGSGTIAIAASTSAANGNVQNTAAGSTLEIVAINATEWIATYSAGTWTVT